MHPGDQTGTVGIIVGLCQQIADFLGGFHNRLEHHLAGDGGGGVQAFGNNAGVAGHFLQRFWAVQVLASGHKPKFISFHVQHI
ncbi:hypothetical protein D3C76_1799410 [compost metagenome]